MISKIRMMKMEDMILIFLGIGAINIALLIANFGFLLNINANAMTVMTQLQMHMKEDERVNLPLKVECLRADIDLLRAEDIKLHAADDALRKDLRFPIYRR